MIKPKTINFLLTFVICFLGITLIRYIFSPVGMWEFYIVIFRAIMSLFNVYIIGVFNIIKEE